MDLIARSDPGFRVMDERSRIVLAHPRGVRKMVSIFGKWEEKNKTKNKKTVTSVFNDGGGDLLLVGRHHCCRSATASTD